MTTALRDAVICEPLRTPVGKYGGALRDQSAASLAAKVIEALIERTGMDGARVDDVILGQCYPSGEAPALGRVAALDAGLPVQVPGQQIDRRCGSALMAVLTGAMQVQTGASELVIAGGAESMSRVEFYTDDVRWGTSGSVALHDRLTRARETAGGQRYPVPGGMLETAENLRRDYDIGRSEQDELAVRSHERAIRAMDEGLFTDELVPVPTNGRSGVVVVGADEHPRRGSSLEALSKLRPALEASDAESTVTAGNSSGQNDGAAACIVTTRELAEQLGIRPLARVVSWASAGVDPSRMGVGPVPATNTALERAGLTLAEIDLIELNEAFAAQVLACTRAWGFAATDFDRLNVNGSGISLGHPVGATGARILATLLRELDRRECRYGLETMCIGGGQGLAAIFERIAN